MKNQSDLFVRYMAGTPYILVCMGLAFLKIPEITYPVIIIYMVVYILCFAVLSIMFTLFKYMWNPLTCETKNSNVVENGPPFVHIASIEKKYDENVINWAFQKAFWLSFPTTAIIVIAISPYL